MSPMTVDTNQENETSLLGVNLDQLLDLQKNLPWNNTHNLLDKHNILSDTLKIHDYIDIVLKSEKVQKKNDILEQLIWKKILYLGDLNLSSPLKVLKDINYYELFDLENSSTREEIEKSYLKLIKIWNPTRNNNSQESISNYRLISKIYKILSNQSNRESYDRFLESSEKEVNMCISDISSENRTHINPSSINKPTDMNKTPKVQFVKIFSSNVRRKISRDIERRQNYNSLPVTKMIWNSYLSMEKVFTFTFKERKQLKEPNLKYFRSLLIQCQKVIEERLSIYYNCQIKIYNQEECTISCQFNSKNKLKFNEANLIYSNLLRILSFDTFIEQKMMLCIWLISIIPVTKDNGELKKRKSLSSQLDDHVDESAYRSEEEEVILLRPTTEKV